MSKSKLPKLPFSGFSLHLQTMSLTGISIPLLRLGTLSFFFFFFPVAAGNERISLLLGSWTELNGPWVNDWELNVSSALLPLGGATPLLISA